MSISDGYMENLFTIYRQKRQASPQRKRNLIEIKSYYRTPGTNWTQHKYNNRYIFYLSHTVIGSRIVSEFHVVFICLSTRRKHHPYSVISTL